ncbi:Hypothetical protein DHA2_151357 [Giardia duodenalis]|uniref:Glucoamylase S1/S2 n=1 Tax=Giardia intestinalis TaxID=5741 RepID=V6TS10_GIAIN|nr:Hypothetical protein DHA2_151357 [Giardia intestinalis]
MDDLFDFQNGFSFGSLDGLGDSAGNGGDKKNGDKAPDSIDEYNLDNFNIDNFLEDTPGSVPAKEEAQKKSQPVIKAQEKDPFAGASDLFDFGSDEKPASTQKDTQQTASFEAGKEDDIVWGDFYQEDSPRKSPGIAQVEPRKDSPVNNGTGKVTVSNSAHLPSTAEQHNGTSIDKFDDDFGDDFGNDFEPNALTVPEANHLSTDVSEPRAITPNPEPEQLSSSMHSPPKETLKQLPQAHTDAVTDAWPKTVRSTGSVIGKVTGSQFVKARQPSLPFYEDTSDEAVPVKNPENPFTVAQKPIYYSPPKSELTTTTDETSALTTDASSHIQAPATAHVTAIPASKQAPLPPRSRSTSPTHSDTLKRLQDQMNVILHELKGLTVGPDMTQLTSALTSEIIKHLPKETQQGHSNSLQASDIQSLIQNALDQTKESASSLVDPTPALHGIEHNMRRLEESIATKLQSKFADDSCKEGKILDTIKRLELQMSGIQSEVSSLAVKAQHYKQVHVNDPNVLALNAAINLAEERAKRAEDRYNESIQKVSDLTAEAKRAMEEAERAKIEANTALTSANLREAKARDLEEELNRLMESLHTRERNIIARESELRKKEANLRERNIQLETEMLKLTTQKAELEELKAKADASRQLSILERNQLIKEQEELINNNILPNPAPVPLYTDLPYRQYPSVTTSPHNGGNALSMSAIAAEPQKRSKSAAREDLERAVSKADKALKTSRILSTSQMLGNQKAEPFLVDTTAHSSLAALEYDLRSTDPKREALRVARKFLQEKALAKSMTDTRPPKPQPLVDTASLAQSLSLNSSNGAMNLTAMPTRPHAPPYVISSGSEKSNSMASSLPSSRTSYVEPPIFSAATATASMSQYPSQFSTQRPSLPYSSRPTSRTSDNIVAQIAAINRPFTPITFDQSQYTPAEVIRKASLATVTPIVEAQNSFATRTTSKPSSFDISSGSAPLGPLTSETSKSTDIPIMTAVSQLIHRQPSAQPPSNSTSTEIAVLYDQSSVPIATTKGENLDVRESASIVTAVQNLPSASTSAVDPEASSSRSGNETSTHFGTQQQKQPDHAMGSTAVQLQPPTQDLATEPSMSASAPIPYPTNRENPMLAVQSSKSDPSTSGSISAVTTYKKQPAGEQEVGHPELNFSYPYQAQVEPYAFLPQVSTSQPGLLDALSESNQNRYSTSRFTAQNEFYEFSPQISTSDLGYPAHNPFADIKYDLGLSNFNSNEHSTSPMFPF